MYQISLNKQTVNSYLGNGTLRLLICQTPCLVLNQQGDGTDCNYSDLPALRSATTSAFWVTLPLMPAKTSAKSTVPTNTSTVPSQWRTLNGLLKNAMEMSRERNLRSVTTNVTVSAVHSLVSMNTDLIHTYLAQSQVLWNIWQQHHHELLTATCTGIMSS